MKTTKLSPVDAEASEACLPRPNPTGAKRTRFGCGGTSVGTLVALLVVLPLLAAAPFVYRGPYSDRILGLVNYAIQPYGASSPEMNSLDGLLPAGFDRSSCLSRYESSSYRKPSPHKPSSNLISRLQKYEDLHRRCGPNTEAYKQALKHLDSETMAATTKSDCNYIVYIGVSGLGNRILTIAASFLYAILTDRVLLVHPPEQISDLFCEPFQNTSWILPEKFPISNQFGGFKRNTPHSHGFLARRHQVNSKSETTPSYLYLHLVHDYDVHDKRFFCDEDQAFLKRVPWLIIKSNIYFLTSIFMIPSFEQDLAKLFPEKSVVFHHLGRYLFHPTNQVWGLITRFYNSYMAAAEEKIGIQVRVFESFDTAFKRVKQQILDCALSQNLLPQIQSNETITNPPTHKKSKSVLITSLNSGYYDNLRELYLNFATVNLDVVSISQPSHEEVQQNGPNHIRKAWAEMYLLSLMDKLVTSAKSTFGYVAQGLGGIEPVVLYMAVNGSTPDPPCGRALSMEPCFQAPPARYCGVGVGLFEPYLRQCEDIGGGLKLFDEKKVIS